MRAGVCACVHVHVCMFSYMYIHTYVNVLFLMYVHNSNENTHARTHAHTYAYMCLNCLLYGCFSRQLLCIINILNVIYTLTIRQADCILGHFNGQTSRERVIS